MPLTLGFDTATMVTTVATGPGEDGLERNLAPEEGRPVHGTALLAAIEELAEAAGGWREIDLFAVGIGPGSFTGLRIGISTARGLAQSLGLPLVGVPSTSALLAGLDGSPDAEGRGRLAIIDARRSEVFAAAAAGSAPGEPIVCKPAELVDRLGPEAIAGAVAAGDGAVRFRSEVEASGAVVLPDGDPAHRLSARRICELAAKMEPDAPERIRPLYLRRPDAERWRERDGRN